MMTLKHPSPDQLEPLLRAVDTAVWTWAVKTQTRRGNSVKVDWKSAQQDLAEAWHMFQIACDAHILAEQSRNDCAEGK